MRYTEWPDKLPITTHNPHLQRLGVDTSGLACLASDIPHNREEFSMSAGVLGTTMGIILVLFILLVIVLRSWCF